MIAARPVPPSEPARAGRRPAALLLAGAAGSLAAAGLLLWAARGEAIFASIGAALAWCF